MNGMNGYFFAAGLLSIAVAAVHSVLGELWVFRRMRRASSLVPTDGGSVLREPHVRILWASWHVLSVLGLALAALLLHRAFQPGSLWIPAVAAAAMAVSAALVGLGTRGRHPGWIGLLGVAVLSGVGCILDYSS